MPEKGAGVAKPKRSAEDKVFGMQYREKGRQEFTVIERHRHTRAGARIADGDTGCHGKDAPRSQRCTIVRFTFRQALSILSFVEEIVGGGRYAGVAEVARETRADSSRALPEAPEEGF